MTPAQARAFVQARLGRPPQDALEAAVVLEAWGGISSSLALDLGTKLLAGTGASKGPPSGTIVEAPNRPATLLDHLGLVLVVAIIAAWGSPLAVELTTPPVGWAWRMALVMALGLHWVLRRRYLGAVRGLGSLRRARRVLAVLVPSVVVVPWLGFGLAGVLAGLLVLIWLGATVIALRGWGWWFGGLLLLAAIGVRTELPALPTFVFLAAVSVLLAAWAIASSADPGARPGPWRRALLAGTVGAGLGLMLVLERGVRWGVDGELLVLAFLPSFVGALWGGTHLGAVWGVMSHAARATPLGLPDPAPWLAPVGRLLLGSAARLLGGALVLSLAVVLPASTLGVPVRTSIGLLTGFALISLASMIIGLLESANRVGWAIAAVSAGALAALAVRLGSTAEAMPGIALIVAAILTLIVSLPPTLGLVRHPSRELATAMFIP